MMPDDDDYLVGLYKDGLIDGDGEYVEPPDPD
jgi:hypothetical protein